MAGEIGGRVKSPLKKQTSKQQKDLGKGLPWGAVVKTLPSSSGGTGSIPSREAKITRALRPKKQNIRQKQCCKKFNKKCKNGPYKKPYKNVVCALTV